MSFTERDLRDTLGLFPTGVTVITASTPEDGSPLGITVSSFNSVSLDPPLILFSVAHSSYSLPALLAAECFAVNVLHEGQREVSTRFARALEDKWSTTSWIRGRTGVPLISGAIATFECNPHAHYDGGDHVIVVGRVVHIAASGPQRPLIFFRGRYNSLRSDAGGEAPYDSLMLHGW
jgi:flavin reductase (DIM6/NTAB) family NADH-FMN oxidoreductase RutF